MSNTQQQQNPDSLFYKPAKVEQPATFHMEDGQNIKPKYKTILTTNPLQPEGYEHWIMDLKNELEKRDEAIRELERENGRLSAELSVAIEKKERVQAQMEERPIQSYNSEEMAHQFFRQNAFNATPSVAMVRETFLGFDGRPPQQPPALPSSGQGNRYKLDI